MLPRARNATTGIAPATDAPCSNAGRALASKYAKSTAPAARIGERVARVDTSQLRLGACPGVHLPYPACTALIYQWAHNPSALPPNCAATLA
jgi:hypothetical protein